MSPKENFGQLVLNLLPLLYPIFSIYMSGSVFRIGSGSTKLLNTDPLRIRIHNTDFYYVL